MKRNERDWAGQLVSWIQQAIHQRRTVFQNATNDTGIKLASGRTKFPDILLFTDKNSGIVFNGWELKYPDTAVDDKEMLENALEKAERLKADSFVTWNGTEAIIWKIANKNYNLESISRLKVYPREATINTREDLSDQTNYNNNEYLLIARANDILHDLEQFYISGELRHAINISGNIIEAVIEAANIILPQFANAIRVEKGDNATFRGEFEQWKIYENSTLKILASSSRRPTKVIEEEVLARFTFYNLIGKILFYLTLSENLSSALNRIQIVNQQNIKQTLDTYFASASAIDYQAIFQPYFTDNLSYSPIVDQALYQLINRFTEFDFRILPTEVIGTILENLVPNSEKQKFGQYFTSETLANLVSFPAIQTRNDYVFDPTSGTGTFLNSFYNILKYHGTTDHSLLLNQVWGNDISHFPAILSVINLYKQDLTNTDNFPRITRDDFFNLNSGLLISFPDSSDFRNHIEQAIPNFDAIASNFPFIQQEDIPNEKLTTLFREKFESNQQAFLRDRSFKINERSDYFTYCIYNSIRFLKSDGFISAVTSNAWLGKEYGIQFKKFLLDNFHIKYVVKSNAEHWFSDSKVSTIYSVIKKCQNSEPTKFITINFKLLEQYDQENLQHQLEQIENFYAEIDNCDYRRNPSWRVDENANDVYYKIDNSVKVCIVNKSKLIDSLETKDNWSKFFLSSNLFESIESHLIQLYPEIISPIRGERTGWNPMFVIPENEVAETGIEPQFLIPLVKSPSEVENLEFSANYNFRLFVCHLPLQQLRANYVGAYNWIIRFENALNTNGLKTIKESCKDHRPYWYSLRPKRSTIITAINPYERYFFSFSRIPFTIDQRLIAINVNNNYNVELIAALLNSVLTFLTIEMRGTSRNLGVLDLNADYMKQIRMLDPRQLTPIQESNILSAFQPLKRRQILTIFDEVRMEDRLNFDRTILRSYNIDENLLESFNQMLISLVHDRISMKDK